jgi:hypothetical protein
MEVIEHLSLTCDGLDDDPVLSYMPKQLYHHVVTHELLANPLRGHGGAPLVSLASERVVPHRCHPPSRA